MKEHYNLYYLLLEDKEANPLAGKRKKEILEIIRKFSKNIKPP